MHRSGTSLVSNWLHDSGLFLGKDLYGASQFNAGGYFEDVDFIRLHETLLSELGVHPTGHEMPLHRSQEATPQMIERLREFVDARRSQQPWGWKDPRSCLLLDLYREATPDACYLIVLRAFEPVTLSLIKRERALQSKWAQLARVPGLRTLCRRFFEHKFTDYYLSVVEIYFEQLLAHIEAVPDRCVVLNLDRFSKATNNLAKALRGLGVELNPVPVTNVLRPSELSTIRDLRFANPALLTKVEAQYMHLLSKALH